MTILSWLTLCGIGLLGAMSPGPSLAVILQNRLQRGLKDALVASWSHAAGIFVWALTACTALGTLFKRFPAVKTTLTLAGAIFLMYLAVKSWGSRGGEEDRQKVKLPAASLSGLSIAMLNPKILVFFTALFSQFIPEKAAFSTLLGMACLAGAIDGTWYSFVSLCVGIFGLDKSLGRHGLFVNRLSAGVYVVVAGFSFSQFFQGLAA